MQRNDIKKIIAKNEYLRNKLFYKGFFLTDDNSVDFKGYPFSDFWRQYRVNDRYTLLTHDELATHIKVINDEITVVLLGHAYDPVSNVSDESLILERVSNKLLHEEKYDSFFESVNDLTGVFFVAIVYRDKVVFFNDAVGLFSVFYSCVKSCVYVSSHSNLIGDVLGLSEDPFVKKLKSRKNFKYFGNQLPGNITQFAEVKRQNPNHYTVVKEQAKQIRFYWPHYKNESLDELCSAMIEIMKNTTRLISEKWNKPAISLTGGCDSKTTLACCSERYDKFTYFSYDSQPNEAPDAEAAAKICENLNLPHTLYKIPYNDDFCEDIEDIRAVLLWNGGDIRYNNPNDVRKRIFLDKKFEFDIEVKSWASEVGRSRYTKRYNGRTDFGDAPTPRVCTTFYKFLPLNRIMVNKCDKIFSSYLDQYFESAPKNAIPWQDQFYWEWHWPSRDGVCLICEQIFSNDITVPYNNRRVLELLLSASEADRINDVLFAKIRQQLDERIDAATQSVVDVNHTGKRALLEDIYYRFNTIILF